MASSTRRLDFLLQRRVSLYLAGNLRSPQAVRNTSIIGSIRSQLTVDEIEIISTPQKR
jgi:hypothetical protein